MKLMPHTAESHHLEGGAQDGIGTCDRAAAAPTRRQVLVRGGGCRAAPEHSASLAGTGSLNAAPPLHSAVCECPSLTYGCLDGDKKQSADVAARRLS